MSHSIPCMIMRGGTSRGPYLRLEDLPNDREACAAILQHIMGAGHELQLDGIGGGNSLTSKVAMVGRSDCAEADVDYLFAQVGIAEKKVDFSPNCGNMLAGVAPFAIETGLVMPQACSTLVRIRNLNTNKIIHAQVPTVDGNVVYDGDTLISGAPNPAAPIKLTFIDVQGAKTGRLFPTGHLLEEIDGIAVTCIDAAMPCVLIHASDLGKTGSETPAELDSDEVFMARLEKLRQQAGQRMGLGDVSEQVIPKPVLLSAARHGGTLQARYFVPQRCHKALAVTGSIAIATAAGFPETVAGQLIAPATELSLVQIEHPTGSIDLEVVRDELNPAQVKAVSLLRTARKILSGTVFLP
ncbi:4-oxalomesaconate tautomerase [Pokkaliibacter plantistimulans]|nr:4-oxalomesaconate tautomerase [Pokkaliibacter plantistimulans]